MILLAALGLLIGVSMILGSVYLAKFIINESKENRR